MSENALGIRGIKCYKLKVQGGGHLKFSIEDRGECPHSSQSKAEAQADLAVVGRLRHTRETKS